MNSTSIINKALDLDSKKVSVWRVSKYHLWGLWDMFIINGDVLYRIARRLEFLCGFFDYEYELKPLPEEDRMSMLGEFDSLISNLQELELTSSMDQAQRIAHILSTEGVTYAQVKALIPELQSRTEDALRHVLMIFIESRNARYYREEDLFGELVTIVFPSAILDIEEAGKCIAVGRNTACVFHLMRVIEIGVMSFAGGLGILEQVRSAQPSWGGVLRLTGEEIHRRNRDTDPDWTPDKRGFFENVQADLSAVKNAWRNPTMHVENTYDEERAEDIFNSVKGFMRHLAKHLDESGNFTS